MKEYMIERINKDTLVSHYYNDDSWLRVKCTVKLSDVGLAKVESNFVLNIFDYVIYEVVRVKVFNT